MSINSVSSLPAFTHFNLKAPAQVSLTERAYPLNLAENNAVSQSLGTPQKEQEKLLSVVNEKDYRKRFISTAKIKNSILARTPS